MNKKAFLKVFVFSLIYEFICYVALYSLYLPDSLSKEWKQLILISVIILLSIIPFVFSFIFVSKNKLNTFKYCLSLFLCLFVINIASLAILDIVDRINRSINPTTCHGWDGLGECIGMLFANAGKIFMVIYVTAISMIGYFATHIGLTINDFIKGKNKNKTGVIIAKVLFTIIDFLLITGLLFIILRI